MMFDFRKFAKPVSFGKARIIRFGDNTSEEIASQLRMFADEIERGNILVVKIQSAQVVSLGDYYQEALFIEYHRTEETDASLKTRKIERITERPTE